MSQVELRLLGEFDARLDGERVEGFESQKARALLAYLALHRDRRVERKPLAALLWSERSEISARRNLRQALHNVRSAFVASRGLPPLFVGGRQTVQLNPELDCWIDVEAFERAVADGLRSDSEETARLAVAARIYSGDLLAGFALADSPIFEEWLGGEQERLRQAAIETLRRLVTRCLEAGDYRPGIDYAHRLLTIDPLSEETHRQLMLLYSQSDRHSHALAQYRSLRILLRRELGVDPLPETDDLYHELLDVRAGAVEEVDTAVGPILPLVGRVTQLERLEASWRQVAAGGARLALLVGPDGSGKTRLARSFLGRAELGRGSVVRSIALGSAEPGAGPIEQLLEEPTSSGRTEVLLLDDLQLADAGDLQRIGELLVRRADGPLWIVATSSAGAAVDLLRGPADRLDRIPIGPLDRAAIEKITSHLLDGPDAGLLAKLVDGWSRGLPLEVAELINFLWDEGTLLPLPSGGWELAGELPMPLPGDFDELIAMRLGRLPASARRLLVTAALLGASFDRETIARAAGEHPAVVDACIEVLLDRWLIRWAAPAWSATKPPSDRERWSRGTREGSLQIAHRRIGEAILRTLDQDRVEALRHELDAST